MTDFEKQKLTELSQHFVPPQFEIDRQSACYHPGGSSTDSGEVSLRIDSEEVSLGADEDEFSLEADAATKFP